LFFENDYVTEPRSRKGEAISSVCCRRACGSIFGSKLKGQRIKGYHSSGGPVCESVRLSRVGDTGQPRKVEAKIGSSNKMPSSDRDVLAGLTELWWRYRGAYQAKMFSGAKW